MTINIRAMSFDADGCVFHSHFKSKTQNIVEHNQELLDTLTVQNKAFDKAVTYIGSNRQSYVIDFMNGMRGTGSCYTAIDALSQSLKAEFCPLLMADIYNALPEGESYTRAVKEGMSRQDHKDWIFDDTKATILYAQMHHIANAYHNDDIVFDFFDDKTETLRSLNVFFARNPELIPQNVALRLNKYVGKVQEPKFNIQGSGMIDRQYRQTVIDMAKMYMDRFYPDVKPKADGSLDLMAMSGKHIDITCFDLIDPSRLMHREPLVIAGEVSGSEPLTVPTMQQAVKEGLSFFEQEPLKPVAEVISAPVPVSSEHKVAA